jgi:alkylhydroperoxidase family enzyme
MATFDKVVSKAAENLLGDERLRSNLTDDEAQVAMDWALARVKAQANAAKDEAGANKVTQGELARVRAVLSSVNQLLAKPGTPRLSDTVAAVETLLQSGKPFNRQEIIKLVTALAGAAASLRDNPTTR